LIYKRARFPGLDTQHLTGLTVGVPLGTHAVDKLNGIAGVTVHHIDSIAQGLKMLQLDLSGCPPVAPVLKAHLKAEPAKPRRTQHGLFVPSSPEPEKLELTVARLRHLVGDGRVGTPELKDTHRPDSFIMRDFITREFAPRHAVNRPRKPSGSRS